MVLFWARTPCASTQPIAWIRAGRAAITSLRVNGTEPTWMCCRYH